MKVHFTGIKGVGMTPLRQGFEGRGGARIHFTGIKGVGMTALALAHLDAGWEVTGSDTKEFQITDPVLKARGIKVFEKFTPRNIWELKKMVWVPSIDKLIYTGAHHGAQNTEVKWAVSRGVPTLNYARALGEFFADKKQICVCGVGGKTTTTAMIATILQEAAEDPSWIIGTSEIPSLPASGRLGKGEWAVIESDEYVADPVSDRTPKFMYMNPKILVCTNIRHDHPDVFPKEEDAIEAYVNFFNKLPKDGLLLLSSQVSSVIPAILRQAQDGEQSRTKAGIYLNRSRVKRFDRHELTAEWPGMTKSGPGMVIYDKDQKLLELVEDVIAVPGDYNIKNAMAAVSVAEFIGIPREKALGALKKYTGSKRRFEYIGTAGGTLLYDDYAHHPHEIENLLSAVRQKFPQKKIKFVFQPHTYSRTKALINQFAECLKTVDEVILAPIFASARESADPEISSGILAKAINDKGGKAVFIADRKKLVKYLIGTSGQEEVIFTVGAGNLYEIHSELKQGLGR